MIRLVLVFLMGVVSFAFAGDDVEKNDDDATTSHEFSSSASYSGKSNIKQGSRSMGTMDSQHEGLRYVASVPLNEGIFIRAGVDYDRFGFGTSNVQFIPNTLEEAAFVVGADIEISDKWLMRVEMEPGLYSDFQDISFDDMNAPVVIGGSYLPNKDLQWFFGIHIDPRSSKYPVMPGAGVRWKFADQWTLMFLLPKPRIEYAVMDNMILYAGAEILAGGFTVAKDFGQRWGRTDLNNDYVEYREIRTGLGTEWKALPFLKVSLDGGWVWDRQFEDDRSHLTLHQSNGAPYSQASVSMNF
jgi:hypothetical protein